MATSQARGGQGAVRREIPRSSLGNQRVRRSGPRRRSYDVLMAYSGGKDSTYTLLLLRRKYGLRVLALSFDNGFVSPGPWRTSRPSPTPSASTTSSSSRAGTCCGRSSRTAAERGALLEEDPRARQHHLHLLHRARQGHLPEDGHRAGDPDGRLRLVSRAGAGAVLDHAEQPGPAQDDAAGDPRAAASRSPATDVAAYFLERAALRRTRSVSPGTSTRWRGSTTTRARSSRRSRALGWMPPEDTDSNSTNCLLNAYANEVHLRALRLPPLRLGDRQHGPRGGHEPGGGTEKFEQSVPDSWIAPVKEKLGLSG